MTPVLAFLTLLAAMSTAETRVEVVREGTPVAVAETAKLVTLVAELAEQSSVNSTPYVEGDARWKAALVAPTRIRVDFGGVRRLRLIDVDHVRRQVPVREILLVVRSDAWPDHILVRTEAGVQALTKYSPCGLLRLIQVADLAMVDRERTRYGAPYEKLCGARPEGAVHQ